jgi:hypothetical protein
MDEEMICYFVFSSVSWGSWNDLWCTLTEGCTLSKQAEIALFISTMSFTCSLTHSFRNLLLDAVYIGLYSYNYLTVGNKVMTLFMARGWTTMINDNLVMFVLVLVSFVIGALTGVFGLLLAALHPGWVNRFILLATTIGKLFAHVTFKPGSPFVNI